MPDPFRPDIPDSCLLLADTAAGRDLALWLAFALVGAGIVALGVIIAVLVLERARRRMSPVQSQPPPTTDDAAHLLDLMNRAEALADRIGRDLDERTRRAQRTLDQLDRRLAAADPTTLNSPAAVPQPPTPTTRQPPHTAPEPRPTIVVRPPPTARSPVSVAAATPAIDTVTPEVYRLADGGVATAEIARRVNQSPGTIELILALRPR